MAETLSLVAIFVSFVAVYFTAEVVKRLNQRSDPSQNPFVIALAQGLEQKDRWIVGLDQRLKILEGEVRAVRGEDSLGPGRRPIAEIERDLDSISRGLRKAKSLQKETWPERGAESRGFFEPGDLEPRVIEPRGEARARQRAGTSAA